MGFCIFNNTSVAAAYAREELGLDRVAILDWDVHHGNGTQDIWWNDPSVLTISLHQHLCFPANSGFTTERGEGEGLGYNLNIPLPPGGGNVALPAVTEEEDVGDRLVRRLGNECVAEQAPAFFALVSLIAPPRVRSAAFTTMSLFAIAASSARS